MFCKNCGTELNEAANFCPKCGVMPGAEVQQPEAPIQAEEVVAEQPVVELIAEETPVTELPTANPGKGLGIAALVLGIVALAVGSVCSCGCACLGGLIPFVCGVLGIVFGAIASKKSKEAGFGNTPAKVGLILSIVSIVIILLFILANGILGAINGIDSVFANRYAYNYNYTI